MNSDNIIRKFTKAWYTCINFDEIGSKCFIDGFKYEFPSEEDGVTKYGNTTRVKHTAFNTVCSKYEYDSINSNS